MLKSELLASIDKTATIAYPLFLGAMPLTPDFIAQHKKGTRDACVDPSKILIDFLAASKSASKALDLGCGSGANSWPLVDNGWEVVAMDSDRDMLKRINARFTDAASLRGSIRVIEGDITATDFAENMTDLVVAVDVLSYLPARSLYPTVEKIHRALRSGGTFIGTLFFDPKTESTMPFITLLHACGAHFYEGEYIAEQLLKHIGFHIHSASVCIDDLEVDSAAVEFIATKL